MALFSKLHSSYPLPPTVNSSRDFAAAVGISGEGGGGVHLHVTCALIEQEGRVFCTRRSAGMSLPLKWEFPGGKIKEGESREGCLRRELFEELGVDVKIGRELPPVTHRYPEFRITLHPFLCTIDPSEKITLHEHDQAAWIPPEELGVIDWAAADVGVVKNYLEFRTQSGKGSGNPRGKLLTKDKTP